MVVSADRFCCELERKYVAALVESARCLCAAANAVAPCCSGLMRDRLETRIDDALARLRDYQTAQQVGTFGGGSDGFSHVPLAEPASEVAIRDVSLKVGGRSVDVLPPEGAD